jgi:ribosomal-protein-alanine N-acetyltransferase
MTTSETARLRFEHIQEADLDTVMEIEVEAYPEPWTRGMFRDEIRSPRSYFYTAFLEDVIAGYVGFWLILDEAHITSVTVRNTFRGRGFGRQLMEFVLREARQCGATMATLEVRESNAVARSLYESLGFRVVGRRKGYYPTSREDGIVMLKEPL